MTFVSILIVHAHTTYHSLHHLHPLPPDLVDHFRYVDRVFLLYLLQNMVNGDEGASTTNSSTERKGEGVSVTHCHRLSLSPAVDHHGALRELVVFPHSPVEG